MDKQAVSAFFGNLQKNFPVFREMTLSQYEQNLQDPQKLSAHYKNIHDNISAFQNVTEDEFYKMLGVDSIPTAQKDTTAQSQSQSNDDTITVQEPPQEEGDGKEEKKGWLASAWEWTKHKAENVGNALESAGTTVVKQAHALGDMVGPVANPYAVAADRDYAKMVMLNSKTRDERQEAVEKVKKGEGTPDDEITSKSLLFKEQLDERQQEAARKARRDFGEDEDFVTLLKNGNVGGALELGLITAIESSPQMIMAINPAGLAVVGTLSAADEYDRLARERKDMSVAARAVQSVSVGAIEAFFESRFNPLKIEGKLPARGKITQMIKDYAARGAKETLEDVGKVLKVWAKDTVGEGIEEIGTSFTTDIVKTIINLFDKGSEGYVVAYEEAKAEAEKNGKTLDIRQFAEDVAKGYINDFIGGAAAGAYMGAAGHTGHAIAESVAKGIVADETGGAHRMSKEERVATIERANAINNAITDIAQEEGLTRKEVMRQLDEEYDAKEKEIAEKKGTGLPLEGYYGYLDKLHSHLEEGNGTDATESEADGIDIAVKPTEIEVGIQDKETGKKKHTKIVYSGDSIHFNNDGTIDESRSKNIELIDRITGKKYRWGKRKEIMAALNDELRKARIAEIDKLQKEESERVQKEKLKQEEITRKEKIEAQKKQLRDTMTLRDGVVDTKSPKTTPAHIFLWNLDNHGEEEAVKRAARAVGESLYLIDKLEDDTKMSSTESDAEMDRANLRVRAYEQAVRDLIGNASAQKLRQDAEGQRALLYQRDVENANEEERKSLERREERRREREENRRKFAEQQNNEKKSGKNLDIPEKSSNFAPNSESNDNTGVQQPSQAGNQSSQSEPQQGVLGGNREDASTDNGADNAGDNAVGVRSGFAAIDSLDSLNEDIDGKMRAKGVLFPNVRVICVGAQDFHDAIAVGRTKNANGWRVDVKSVEELEHCYCMLTEDGHAGIAVKEDGDIVSLFSDSTHGGIYKKLLLMAIANGGVKADFFMSAKEPTGLQNLYWRLGARITGQNPFSEEVGREYVNGWVDYYDKLVAEFGEEEGRRRALNHPTAAAIFPSSVDAALDAYVERHGKNIEDELDTEEIAKDQIGLKGIPVFDDYDKMIDARNAELENGSQEQQSESAKKVDLTDDDVVMMRYRRSGSNVVLTFARKETNENGDVVYKNLGCPFGDQKKIGEAGKIISEKTWEVVDKNDKLFYLKDDNGNVFPCYAITKNNIQEEKFTRGSKLNAVDARTGAPITGATSMQDAYVIKEKDGESEELSILKAKEDKNEELSFSSIQGLLKHNIRARNASKDAGESEITITPFDLLYGRFSSDENNYAKAVEFLHAEAIKANEPEGSGAYTKYFRSELMKLLRAWNNMCKNKDGFDSFLRRNFDRLSPEDKRLFWSARYAIGAGTTSIAEDMSLTVNTDATAKEMSQAKYIKKNPLHQLGVMLYIANKLGLVGGDYFVNLPGKSGSAVSNIVTKEVIESKRERYNALKDGKVNYDVDNFVSNQNEMESLEKYFPEVLTDKPAHNRPAITDENEKKVQKTISDNKLQDDAAKEAAKTVEEKEQDQQDVLQKVIEDGFAALEKAIAEKDSVKKEEVLQQLNMFIAGNEDYQRRLQDILAYDAAKDIENPIKKEEPVEEPVNETQDAPAVQEEQPDAVEAPQGEEITEEVPAPEKRRKRNKKETPADQLRKMLENVSDLKKRMALGDREVTPSSIQEATDAIMDFISENGDTEELWNMYNAEFSVSPEQIATTERSRTIGNILLNMIGRIKGPKVHLLNSHDDVMRTLVGLLGTPEFMSAYHGSSAKFSRFDHSHIGEGEGTQFEGWGTYVSLVREVSEYYARLKKMGGNDALFNGERIYPAMLADKLGLDYTESQILLGLFATNKNGADIKQILKMSIEKSKEILQSKTSISDEEYDIKFGPSRYREEDIKEEKKNISRFETILEAIGSDDVKVARNPYDAFVYSVEIPDKTEGNYFLWDKQPTKEHFERINSHLEELGLGRLKGYDSVRGEYTYKVLAEILGSQEKASKFLHECGFVGIEAPVGFNSGRYTDSNEEKNYVIFDENDIKIKRRERIEYLQTPEGTIYGLAIGDEIYITPEGLNADTPIHEFTHLWVKTLRANDRKLWKKIVKELKQNKSLWEAVTNDENYKHLTSDDAIASEVLARFCGKKGAELLEQLAKGQKFGSERLEKAFINRAKRSVRTFWQWVAEKLLGWAGYKAKYGEESIDDFADMVLRDLFDGKALLAEKERNAKEDERIKKEMADIKDKAIEDGTFLKIDGKPSNLPENLWLFVRTKNFKKWFGDWEKDPLHASRVLDENGEPMVVYHGTDKAGFDVFQLSADSDARSGSRGFYTTDNRRVAAGYTKEAWDELPKDAQDAILGADPHEGVYSLFANIRNPMIVDFADENGNKRHWDEYPSGRWMVAENEVLGIPAAEFRSEEEANDYLAQFGGDEKPFQVMLTTDDFIRKAAAEGFDGCVFKNVYDGNFTIGEDMTDYVALTPNQLKSTNNKGYFSTIDDRIEYSKAEEEYEESVGDINNISKKSSENLIKAEKKIKEIGVDITKNFDEKLAAINDTLVHYADMMEGMRIIQNSIAAYRKILRLDDERRGLLKRVFGIGNEKQIVPDIRTMFEGRSSAKRNRIEDFRARERKDLEKKIVQVQKIVMNSDFYKANHIVTIEGQKYKLTPLQFIDLYLMARNNWQRAEDNITRGVPAFQEMFSLDGVGLMGKDISVMSATEQFARAFQDVYGNKVVSQLWSAVSAVTHKALDVAHEGELITDEEYERLSEKRFFVPQRGFWNKRNEENDGENIEPKAVKRKGRWISKLSFMQKAKGGQSLAEGPLAYMFSDVEEAIENAEDNKVKVALFHLLRDSEEWCREPEINFPVPVQVYYTVNPETGDVERLENEYSNAELEEFKRLRKRVRELEKNKNIEGITEERVLAIDEEIDDILSSIPLDASDTRALYSLRNKEKALSTGVLVNGYACEIRFPKGFESLADAFNGKLVIDDSIMKAGTSVFASNLTVNNPTFMPVNAARDIGFINLKGMVEYGPLFNIYFLGNFVAVQKVVNRWLRSGEIPNDVDGKRFGTYMKEFLESGGNTGYTSTMGMEIFRKEVKELDVTSSRFMEIAKKGASAALFKHVAHYINEWSEVTCRFSAYCAVREMGYDKLEGIRAAKNLSVNFDRRGLGNKFLNMFQQFSVFVNATIQGTMGKWRMLGSEPGSSMAHKAGKVAYAIAIAEMVPMFFGFLNTLMLPDDDEEELKVSDWDRDNYIILPNKLLSRKPGWGRIPLDQTTRVPWCIGVNMAMRIKDRRSDREIYNSILTSMVENSFPIPQNISTALGIIVDSATSDKNFNTGEFVLALLTPSYLEQFRYLAEHENFMGGKTRFEKGDLPEFETSQQASKLSRDISKGMYLFSWFGLYEGGDPDVSSKHNIDENGNLVNIGGAHDINPKEIGSHFSGIIVPQGVIDIYATFYGLAWETKDAFTKEDYKFGEYVKPEKLPFVKSFKHKMDPKYTRMETIRNERLEIKTYEDALRNALGQAIRYGAKNGEYLTDNGQSAEYLLRQKAAEKKYADLLWNMEYILKQKALMDTYNKTSTYAAMNEYHVTSEKELQDALNSQFGEKMGEDMYNKIQENEKRICQAMKFLRFEHYGLQWSNKDRKNYMDFFQK